jgi:UDP-2-acetamido-2-deoxy-ribo-hexuluronate aminotransferase
MGLIGTTSFFPTKNLGCMGDGGAIFTNDPDLAIRLQQIANHGQLKKYTYIHVGVNSRLDSIQAAILSVKLNHLDEFINARQLAAAFYDNALVGIEGLVIPERAPWSSHVFHQYTMRVLDGKRDAFKKYLEEAGIPSFIYYPGCIHLQQAYSYLGYSEGTFPAAERLSKEVLSLPMHTELTDEQLAYIGEKVQAFFGR